MQYVSCLYTAQGDYVCQKNQKLDAFYNKPIVEGFYAGPPPASQSQAPSPAAPSPAAPSPAAPSPVAPSPVARQSVPSQSKAPSAAPKVDMTGKYFDNVKKTCAASQNINVCYNNMANLYNSCSTPSSMCTYTPPPKGQRAGAGMKQCESSINKSIEEAYPKVQTATSANDIFSICSIPK